MSLTLATLFLAMVFLVPGALLCWNGQPVRQYAERFLRSRVATVVVFGGAALWFLWHITNLGEADFGNLRPYLLIIFGLVALSSFIVAPDFLSVRGAAVLVLLCAAPLLDAAYMQPQASRLVLVSLVYLAIVLALYFGTVPYRLRDFFVWLFAQPKRARSLGGIMTACAVVLCLAAFTY